MTRREAQHLSGEPSGTIRQLTRGTVWVALYLASVVALHHFYLTRAAFDLSVLEHIHLHATATFTLLAKTLSVLGSPPILWPTILLTSALLWRSGLTLKATFLLAAVAASGLLETAVKLAAGRPRPAVPWAYVHENTYSFPSGHAALAFAFYGTLIYFTRRHPAPQRMAVATLAVVMIIGIGLSRLYLGAHNPTDVLAGYITGAICLLIAILVSGGRDRNGNRGEG